MLCEVLQLIRFRHLVFDDVPFIAPARFDIRLILGLWLLILLALMGGVATRIAAALNLLLTLAVFGILIRLRHFGYHADTIYIPGAMLLALIPSERTLSFDAWRARRAGKAPPAPVNAVCFAAFAVLLAITYADSFLWKLSSPMWRHGLAIWTPVAEVFACARIPPLPPIPWLWKGMSYGAMIFEVLFPMTIWFRRARIPLAVAGIAMHLGIAYLFPLPLFSMGMIALYLPLIPGKFYGAEESRSAAPADAGSRAVSWLLGVWVIAALILAMRVPPLAGSRIGGRAAVMTIRALSLLGVRSHDVYLDGHFTEPRPTMLVFEGRDGRIVLPYTSASGLTGPALYGRVYSNWIWTATMSGEAAAEGSRVIRRYAAFWLGERRLPVRVGRIVVYRRRVVYPHDVDASVLRANQEARWEEAGEISGLDPLLIRNALDATAR
ncbi:MAG: HTTM domain-containing protein [Acidobacteria bacterium]|nr:HTTM domain-containing protein [Acidobacteriota bacterium]